MIHVYLDDYRHCPTGFVLAKNVDECKLLIDVEDIDILSLDYDLGWNEPTGYEVVLHILQKNKFPNKIYLHTSSLYGKQQMYDALRLQLPSHCMLFARPMNSEEILEVEAMKSDERGTL